MRPVVTRSNIDSSLNIQRPSLFAWVRIDTHIVYDVELVWDLTQTVSLWKIGACPRFDLCLEAGSLTLTMKTFSRASTFHRRATRRLN